MQTPYSKQRARQMEALRWSSPSPSMHDAAERWTDASGTTQMERRRELHGHERAVVANAVESWSGRKAQPAAAAPPRESPAPQRRPVSMPPQPKAPEFPEEATIDAEALLADLTSPSPLRRRGAKSALRWMADQDAATYETYDETAAAAVEWEGVNQAAVGVELQDVLDRLGLERYSAELARMGIATLSDVGKRTPDAIIKVAGLSPRECQELLVELLTGCGEPVGRVRLDGPAWERTEAPMWRSPPRWDEPAAPVAAAAAAAGSGDSRTSPTKAAKLAAAAAFRSDREQWRAEREKLRARIASHEEQLARLQQSIEERSLSDNKGRLQERLRSEILMQEISDLEAKVEDWERQALRYKAEAKQLRAVLNELGHHHEKLVNTDTPEQKELFVSGIGVDGWDGTEHGVGRYESEAGLFKIFASHGGGKKTVFLSHLRTYRNASFYQDRLGTNIEKKLKKGTVFPQGSRTGQSTTRSRVERISHGRSSRFKTRKRSSASSQRTPSSHSRLGERRSSLVT
jgi:TolA-binding protein